MSIKQISVFLENKPGALLHMTQVLAEHKIDMRALSLAEAEDFGIARIIVNDLYEATTVLKDAGYIHKITSVIGIRIPDETGGLNQVLQIMSEAGVNLEYMYAFMGGPSIDHAYMIFRVQNHKAAQAALMAKGIKMIDEDEFNQA